MAVSFDVDPKKLLNYLLSTATPEAAGKSRFFHGAGFTAEAWQALQAALLAHPLRAALEYEDPSSPYGRKLIFRCTLPGAPNGRAYCVRSVWQLRGGVYWFLTAYPQSDR